MSKTGFITAVAVLAALTTGLLGCGSGGGNGGGGTHPAGLVGLWQVYQGENDGETVAPGTALGWDDGIIRETVQFLAGGAFADRTYDDAGLANTANGIWSVAAGVLTVVVDGDTKQMTYAIDGNLVTTTEEDNGTTHVVRWAKVVALAGHDAALVRAWTVLSVETDGADHPLADFFEWEDGSDAEVLQLLTDGTFAMNEIAGNEIVNHGEGTWATGGGEIMLTVGPDTVRGAYVPNNTSVTFLDSDGSGTVFELAAFAPAGQQHDPALVGTWQATSATVNGDAVPLADFFEWAAGSDRMVADFYADGTQMSREYNGADVVYADISSWSTAGATMTIVGDGGIVFDNHVIVGNTITLTGTDGGDTIVLVFTRI